MAWPMLATLVSCGGDVAPKGSFADRGVSPDGATDNCPTPTGRPQEIRDTSGGRFGYGCGDEVCRLTQLPDSPAPITSCVGKATKEDQGYVVVPTGKLMRICEVTFSSPDSFTLGAESCRPIACDCTADCPWRWPCCNGLCQSPVGTVQPDDVVALCMADAAWPATCEDWIRSLGERLAVIRQAIADCAGRTSCLVPSTCRQP
jgi:hypothetical protein